MRRSFRQPAFAAVVCALLFVLAARGPASQPSIDLGPRTDVARGVSLYHLTDPALLEPAGPVSIWLLRVDVQQADIRAVLANDEIVDTETVPEMAVRHRALAAVNAGFFLLPSGDPSGIYKLNGQLVSDTRRPRGAVGIVRTDGGIAVRFRPGHGDDDAAGPAAGAARRHHGVRRCRHDTSAGQADAVHARLSRAHRHRRRRTRVGARRLAAPRHGQAADRGEDADPEDRVRPVLRWPEGAGAVDLAAARHSGDARDLGTRRSRGPPPTGSAPRTSSAARD